MRGKDYTMAMDSFDASAPQPAPRGEGARITGLVVKDLMNRSAAGEEKYGTALRAFNGRDALVDAYQEALDLTQYLRQEIEERRSQGIATSPAESPAAPVNAVAPDALRDATLIVEADKEGITVRPSAGGWSACTADGGYTWAGSVADAVGRMRDGISRNRQAYAPHPKEKKWEGEQVVIFHRWQLEKYLQDYTSFFGERGGGAIIPLSEIPKPEGLGEGYSKLESEDQIIRRFTAYARRYAPGSEWVHTSTQKVYVVHTASINRSTGRCAVAYARKDGTLKGVVWTREDAQDFERKFIPVAGGDDVYPAPEGNVAAAPAEEGKPLKFVQEVSGVTVAVETDDGIRVSHDARGRGFIAYHPRGFFTSGETIAAAVRSARETAARCEPAAVVPGEAMDGEVTVTYDGESFTARRNDKVATGKTAIEATMRLVGIGFPDRSGNPTTPLVTTVCGNEAYGVTVRAPEGSLVGMVVDGQKRTVVIKRAGEVWPEGFWPEPHNTRLTGVSGEVDLCDLGPIGVQ